MPGHVVGKPARRSLTRPPMRVSRQPMSAASAKASAAPAVHPAPKTHHAASSPSVQAGLARRPQVPSARTPTRQAFKRSLMALSVEKLNRTMSAAAPSPPSPASSRPRRNDLQAGLGQQHVLCRSATGHPALVVCGTGSWHFRSALESAGACACCSYRSATAGGRRSRAASWWGNTRYDRRRGRAGCRGYRNRERLVQSGYRACSSINP